MRHAHVTAPPARAARAPTLTLVRGETLLFCDACGGEIWRGFDPLGARQLRLVWTCLGPCERVLDEQVVTLAPTAPAASRSDSLPLTASAPVRSV